MSRIECGDELLLIQAIRDLLDKHSQGEGELTSYIIDTNIHFDEDNEPFLEVSCLGNKVFEVRIKELETK